MSQARIIFVLAVTLFACSQALRVASSPLHLTAAVAPVAIQPLVYNSLITNQPNSNPPSSNPAPTITNTATVSSSAPGPNSNPTQTNQAKSIGTQPHSMPPILYPPICTNGKVWSQTELNCLCPSDRPFVDETGQCVGCTAPQFWVAKFLKCMTCPEGFQADKNEGRCYCPKDKPYVDSKITCQPCNTSWDYNTKTCLRCQNNQTFNPNTKKCECQGDFKDDGTGKCTSCPSPADWDLKNKKCVRCPQGFTFDQNTSQCSCPKDKPYLDNNNICQACNGQWDSNSLSCKPCEPNQTWNQAAKKCLCQGESFIDSTGKCVACPKPAAWDSTNKKCVRCPQGFSFDEKSGQCACPVEKPYLNAENVCQACNTKWDPVAYKCLVCTFGTSWNNLAGKCEEKCNYQLVNGKCQCPKDKPVLDQATQECRVCDEASPVWNGKECVSCPPNSYYVAASSGCLFCVGGMVFNKAGQNCQLPK